MFNWDDSEDILYKLEILTILEYVVANGCYRAAKNNGTDSAADEYLVYSINSSAPYNSYSPDILKQRGYSNNFHNIPQISHRYEPQTSVLCCIPRANNSSVMRINIGFILGEISATALSNFENSKPVHITSDPVYQSNVQDMYSLVNQLNQTKYNDYYEGRLGTEAIPGDLVIRGEHTFSELDNYINKIGTDNVNTTYSEITGELIERTKIKQTYSLLAQERTFIIGEDALSLRYGGLDPHKSYLDMYDVKDNKLVKNPDKKPVYALVEAQGSFISGTYRTLYTEEDEKQEIERIPLFQERLAADGKYIVNSANAMRFSKSTLFSHIECEGNTFKSVDELEQNGPKHITAPEPLLQQIFVPKGESDTSAKFNTYTVKDILNKRQSSKELQAFIDFEEDGSIKIRDVWGSYIYLHGGNIQIHAANNIFMVAGRDYMQATGGSISCNASEAIHLKSANSDIAMFAKKDIKYKATQQSVEASYLYVKGQGKVYIDSPNIRMCDSTETGGTITIGNGTTDITIDSRQANILASSLLNMVTSIGGFIVDAGGTITAHGNLKLSGSLIITPVKSSIQVNDKFISTLYEGSGSVFVTGGGVYASQTISTPDLIMADCMIANTMASQSGVLGKVKDFTLTTIKQMLSKCKDNKKQEIKVVKSNITSQELLTFDFTQQSESCTYTAEPCELDGTMGLSSTDQYYSYPGKSFWTESGMKVISVSDNNSKPYYRGFASYGFNQHNTY